MSEGVDQGWVGEWLPRHSKELLILHKDGEARGSVEIFTTKEKERWELAIEFLNEAPTPNST